MDFLLWECILWTQDGSSKMVDNVLAKEEGGFVSSG